MGAACCAEASGEQVPEFLVNGQDKVQAQDVPAIVPPMTPVDIKESLHQPQDPQEDAPPQSVQEPQAEPEDIQPQETTPVKELAPKAAPPAPVEDVKPKEGDRSKVQPDQADTTNVQTEKEHVPVPAPLGQQFQAAVALVREGKPTRGKPTNEEALKLYGLYKQATEGNVKGSQPWKIKYEAHVKWNAWKPFEGKSKEEAQQMYINEFNRQKEAYGIQK